MTSLTLRAGLMAALLTVPGIASAQSQLDRFEALSERLTQLTLEGVALQVPALAGNLPSVEWDRRMRRAGRCALRRYEDAVGEAGVAAMLTEFERAVQTAQPGDILAGNFNAGVPQGLTANDVSSINTACGLTELQTEQLAGVLQALQAQ